MYYLRGFVLQTETNDKKISNISVTCQQTVYRP